MFGIDYQEEKTIYKTTVPVLITHLNPGWHLSYDSLLTIIQDARMYWLKEHNMTEGSIHETTGFVVTGVMVDYKAEAFHGDLLLIEFYVSDVTKLSFIFTYKVSNAQTKKVVAFAKTKQVFFDYEKRKVSRTPACFIKALNE